eukprot:12772-Heterococcus_DN1.PRE.1
MHANQACGGAEGRFLNWLNDVLMARSIVTHIRCSECRVVCIAQCIVLGVPRSASHDEIKKAYRKLALKWHPDVAESSSSAEARHRWTELTTAYEALNARSSSSRRSDTRERTTSSGCSVIVRCMHTAAAEAANNNGGMMAVVIAVQLIDADSRRQKSKLEHKIGLGSMLNTKTPCQSE